MWVRNTTCQIRLQTSDFIPIAAELQGVALAVLMDWRFGWRAVTIFTDSTAASCQAVGLRAKTWVKR